MKPETKVLKDGTKVDWCGVHRAYEWECDVPGCHAINYSSDLRCTNCGVRRDAKGER